MLTRANRGDGHGRFAAAIAAVLITVLLAACSAGQQVIPGTPGTPPDTSAGTPGTPPDTSASELRPLLGDALPASVPLTVRIPAIGVATGQLVQLGLTADRALEVPGDAVTAGWFKLSPTPGEIGPSVIAGHVNYASVPGVFARLQDMKPGDTITVDRADGSSAVFTAYAIERYPKAAFPTEMVYGNTESPELRLITCGGDFDKASHQYLDNVIVFARLTSASR